MRTISSYRKANREGRPLTDITIERKGAAVLVHNERARNRKTLTAASTNLLGGKERVEESVPDILWDPAPRILDVNTNSVTLSRRPHANAAPVATLSLRIDNGVRRVNEQIEEHLIEVPKVTSYERKVAEFGLDIRNVFVLTARNCQRRL